MKKILILYDHRSQTCVTGGQFYEENMYTVMQENQNIETTRHNANRKRSFLTKLVSPFLNLAYYKLCKKNDLIIFNSVEAWYFIPLAILLRSFSRTKIAIIHHHFIFLEFTGVKREYYKRLESTFLRLSNYILTVSPYIKSLCKEKFKNKNIRLWPIPFSNETIITTETQENGNLIYIGTIEPRKGLKYLINSLIILRGKNVDFSLQVIGKVKDFQYYEELLELIKKNNIDVKFYGFINDNQKDYLLKKAQVFVFPSLLEGYGMVIREVMAYGLPIVCFDNSAMPFLVKQNVNGILVENMNSKAMADAIASILTDQSLRKRLSNGSYDSAKKTITPEKYKEYIYSDLCAIL